MNLHHKSLYSAPKKLVGRGKRHMYKTVYIIILTVKELLVPRTIANAFPTTPNRQLSLNLTCLIITIVFIL